MASCQGSGQTGQAYGGLLDLSYADLTGAEDKPRYFHGGYCWQVTSAGPYRSQSDIVGASKKMGDGIPLCARGGNSALLISCRDIVACSCPLLIHVYELER